MKVLHSVHPDDFKAYQTTLIRERFLIGKQVQADQINCTYTHYDRMIVGFANPVNKQLSLPTYPNLKAQYFLERREIGIINIGGDGIINADGQLFEIKRLDCLYIGKGTLSVTFSSKSARNPAVFYMLSAPAHTMYPTALLTNANALKTSLGSSIMANKRTINKYVHKDGIKSCQLVMGLTILSDGSVWNTMPPHTHDRRMEVYFYFDLPEGQKIFHYMGEGNETRHITVDNYDAVVSPSWSVHSGSGTASYSFIWGMAGENLDYTDLDSIAITNIK